MMLMLVMMLMLLLMVVTGVGVTSVGLLIGMAAQGAVAARFGIRAEIVGAGGAPRSRCERLVYWGAPAA